MDMKKLMMRVMNWSRNERSVFKKVVMASIPE